MTKDSRRSSVSTPAGVSGPGLGAPVVACEGAGRGRLETHHERDYLERTIATVRNHQGADNCWPQWANIFADEIERLWKVVERVRALVDEQAEEEGLWAIYPFGEQPIMEAYLQQELRRLHALIEEVT